MLLAGVKDIGSANAVFPILRELQKNSHNILVYADGVSAEKFKDEYPIISALCPLEKVLDWFSYEYDIRAAILGISSAGGVVPVAFTNTCKKRRIPVIAVEDYWASHCMVDFEELPDIVCVQDELAKSLLLESWGSRGYYSNQVIVTGQPAFDHFKDTNCRSANKQLRESLKLDKSWPIIFFPGQIYGMAEALMIVIEALNSIGRPVYFIIRDHPRVSSLNAAEELRQIYKAYKDVPSKLNIGQLIDSSGLKSSDLCTAGADIVVGIYSTILVEACYMRKPTIVIWTPDGQAGLEMESGNNLHRNPVAVSGAALEVSSSFDLIKAINLVYSGDISDMCNAQALHCKADGQSAIRVAQVINNIVNRKHI